MWISNSRNNFAPFAGLMLVGFDTAGRVQNTPERDGEPEDVADTETTETEDRVDDVSV